MRGEERRGEEMNMVRLVKSSPCYTPIIIILKESEESKREERRGEEKKGE